MQYLIQNCLGLPTLELCRLQLDVIFCYKIIFRLTSLTCSDYFQFRNNRNTRGNAYKLYKPQKFGNIRKNFLPCRIITVWNSLPPDTDFSSLAALDERCFKQTFPSFYIVITTKPYCNKLSSCMFLSVFLLCVYACVYVFVGFIF